MATTYNWPVPTNLRNNAAPVDPTDAATKQYVDSKTSNAAGVTGSVQYNSANAFAGGSGFTTDGSNVTVAGTVEVGANITGVNLSVNTTGNINLNPGGNIVLNDDYINGLAIPEQDSDAANKFYVDSVAQGLQVLLPSQLATAAALPSYTYNNGTAGVGATLTGSATGTLTVDGSVVTLGQRILVKDETAGNAPYNGVYLVTTAGASGVAYVLTRATDNNQASEFYGAYTFVVGGSVNAYSGYICAASAASPITVGTSDINWNQFSQAGTVTAGDGLEQVGSQFNVVVDGTTIDINVSNELEIPDGVTLTNANLVGASGDSLTLSDTLTADSASIATLTVSGDASVNGNIGSFGTIETSDSIIAGQNIEASGTITGGQVVTGNVNGPTLTITTTTTNAPIILSPNGNGNVSVANSYVTGLRDPINAQDAATKAYVDNYIDTSSYNDSNVAAYMPTYSGNLIALNGAIGTTNMSNVVIGKNARASGATGFGGAVTIGLNAGQTGQGEFTVAIGNAAGQTNQTRLGVAVGFYAGSNAQSVAAVAVGSTAGQTGQGISAVAVGENAANQGQGSYAIAIGESAGKLSQGSQSIAIGVNAGGGYSSQPQGTLAIAIGTGAGNLNQGTNSVALGTGAGSTTQGANSIALGTGAGSTTQGANAIAIGTNAGNSGQANNSIIINASGNNLTSSTTGLFINPVRNDANMIGQGTVFYDPVLKEITYDVIANSCSGLTVQGTNVQIDDLGFSVSTISGNVVPAIQALTSPAIGYVLGWSGYVTRTAGGIYSYSSGNATITLSGGKDTFGTVNFNNTLNNRAEKVEITIINYTNGRVYDVSFMNTGGGNAAVYGTRSA